MTVGELKRFLEHYPDYLPVITSDGLETFVTDQSTRVCQCVITTAVVITDIDPYKDTEDT